MSTRKMAIKITINKAAAGGADVEEVEEEKEKRNCKKNTSETKDQAVFP